MNGPQVPQATKIRLSLARCCNLTQDDSSLVENFLCKYAAIFDWKSNSCENIPACRRRHDIDAVRLVVPFSCSILWLT